MSGFTFGGFLRFDLGFVNPNKTAAFLAVALISGWFFLFRKNRGFWLAVPLFTITGIALVHAYSRGGLLAAFIGFIPLMLLRAGHGFDGRPSR